MAKRTKPDSPAGPSEAAPAARPRTRRTKSTASSPHIAASTPLPQADPDGSAAATAILDSAAAADESPSSSMASEPSEDDIRIRAYQRFLQRGGGHGMDFEDWLEAERELRSPR